MNFEKAEGSWCQETPTYRCITKTSVECPNTWGAGMGLYAHGAREDGPVESPLDWVEDHMGG